MNEEPYGRLCDIEDIAKAKTVRQLITQLLGMPMDAPVVAGWEGIYTHLQQPILVTDDPKAERAYVFINADS